MDLFFVNSGLISNFDKNKFIICSLKAEYPRLVYPRHLRSNIFLNADYPDSCRGRQNSNMLLPNR